MTRRKKLLSLLTSFALAAGMMSVGASAAAGDVTINSTNFPDANFRSVMSQVDTNGNGVLSAAERQEVEAFLLGSSSIKNLKGIEFFPGLQYLDCTDNQLTKLDVSKNTKLEYLDCSYNQLAALDVTLNTALVGLDCSGNKLTALNVAKNKVLEELYCSENQLTKLDVSGNTKLVYLACYENKLSALSVSANTALLGLDCSDNQLTALSVAKNKALEELYCSGNQLSALDVSANTALNTLYCDDNHLVALNLEKNTAMSDLDASANQTYLWRVAEDGKVQLNELAAYGFNAAKASNFQCGGQSLTFDPATNTLSGLTNAKNGYYTVTYTYNTGNNAVSNPTFTLLIPDGTVARNPFKDVSANQYYYQPVLWAVGKGITTGTSATTFSPLMTCSRSQVVTFLWRAAGEPEPQTTTNPFSDVAAKDYYYKAVLWAVENGITGGTGDGKFSPNAACTRSQVVTFLWRAAGEPEPKSPENPFDDVKDGTFYYKAVLWAVENGITGGTGGGKFSPNDICTRSQIVTFLYRDYNK